MRKYTRVVKRDRQLSQEAAKEFESLVEEFNELLRQGKQYHDDPYISEITDEIIKIVQEADAKREEYLNTPIEEVVEFDYDLDLVESIKQRVANFKKLIAL